MSCLSPTIADWLRQSGQSTDQAAGLALIGLGANLPSLAGGPADTLVAAKRHLDGLSAIPVLLSPIMTSRPVDCPPGSPDFCNAVAVVLPKGDCTPMQLLSDLHSIEQVFGRQRSGLRNEARPLDLDLLAFADAVVDDDKLQLPHPRATQREFVLMPLSQIWPDYRFPGSDQTVKSLLTALSGS